jgi:hypothetical protein
MSGWEFKHPTKRGAHWVELETDMTDDKITPDAVDDNGNVERCVFPLGECTLVAEAAAERDAYRDGCARWLNKWNDADNARIAAESRIAQLEAALRPFADAAYSDNGDVTIDMSHIRTQDWLKARSVYATRATEEARAQKQADKHRARGGYVGGV